LLLRKDAPGAVVVANIVEPGFTIHKWGKIEPLNRPWKDERVRIAFRRSIDYAAIGAFMSNKAEFESNGIPVEMTTTTHVPQNPAYWLDPEKNELGALSQNYFFNVAEAKKLTAAAGYSAPIDLPYYIQPQNAQTDGEILLNKYIVESGVFNVDVRQLSANEYRQRINVDNLFEGIQSQNAPGTDVDYGMFRYYHSGREGGVPFPDPKMDQLSEAQQVAQDYESRISIIKEIQMYLAQKFYQNPGRNHFTTFSFRWPWLHNSNYGSEWPVLGGHLQWLDATMPNRENRI
jgi:hypothetical protein